MVLDGGLVVLGILVAVGGVGGLGVFVSSIRNKVCVGKLESIFKSKKILYLFS